MNTVESLKKIYRYIRETLFVIKNRKLAIEQAKVESYYPEFKRKK